MPNKVENNTGVLELSAEQYAWLANIAEERKAVIPDVASAGLIEWLEKELALAHGRNIMRQLSKGLHKTVPDTPFSGPTDVARKHDHYIYARGA